MYKLLLLMALLAAVALTWCSAVPQPEVENAAQQSLQVVDFAAVGVRGGCTNSLCSAICRALGYSSGYCLDTNNCLCSR